MLFKALKLFGVDVPARMAAVRVDFEERLDVAKESAQQAAQSAAVLAIQFFVASLAALAASGIGLIALYSWVSSNYGQFYGFAAVGGLLVLFAIVMFASAMSKAKSWRAENADRVAAKKRDLAETHIERVAAATEAFEGPNIRPLPPPPPQESSGATAADLIEPLGWALSSTIRLPTTTGNPVLDELFTRLQSSARGAADETVEGLVRAVRHGERPQLFAALGGAILVGWFIGRHSQSRIDVLKGP
jgi:ABC-type multidrug transport system fused ATPase/permease subunit